MFTIISFKSSERFRQSFVAFLKILYLTPIFFLNGYCDVRLEMKCIKYDKKVFNYQQRADKNSKKKEKKNLYENNTRPGKKLQISYQYVKKKISNNANREMVARQYAGVNGVSSQLVLWRLCHTQGRLYSWDYLWKKNIWSIYVTIICNTFFSQFKVCLKLFFLVVIIGNLISIAPLIKEIFLYKKYSFLVSSYILRISQNLTKSSS